MARVLVVDGERSFADALAFRLSVEAGGPHTAVAAHIDELPRQLEAIRPDIVVVGIDPGARNAFDALQHVTSASRPVRSVAIIPADSLDAAAKAVRLGATGVLSKDEATSRLIEIIEGVLLGETHIPPLTLTAVIRHLMAPVPPNASQDRIARLTKRELEVLECIVDGQDRAEIAEALFLSVNTVRTHVKNILAKLDVHSTLEAVGIGLRAGLHHADGTTGPSRTLSQLHPL